MRCFRRLAGLLWLIALGAACDTTQPVLVDSQTVGISFSATNAGATTYLVWDMFEDTDPADGLPDDVDNDGQPDMFLWCVSPDPPFPAPPPNDNTPPLVPTSIPLGFGFEVAIVRAGSTQEEVLTDSATALPNGNLLGYDTRVSTVFTRDKDPVTVTDGTNTMRTFRFTNPRRHTAAHRDVAAAVTNPLFEIDPGSYGLVLGPPVEARGQCSVADPGPVGLAGGANPVLFQLQKGDTLIVRARRGSVPAALAPVVTSQPRLSAAATLDGNPLPVGANTSTQPGTQLRFTVTTR